MRLPFAAAVLPLTLAVAPAAAQTAPAPPPVSASAPGQSSLKANWTLIDVSAQIPTQTRRISIVTPLTDGETRFVRKDQTVYLPVVSENDEAIRFGVYVGKNRTVSNSYGGGARPSLGLFGKLEF